MDLHHLILRLLASTTTATTSTTILFLLPLQKYAGSLSDILQKYHRKALQRVIDSIELQTSPRKNSTTLDPALILSMLLGVNSFYFSGFPTIMGDKLPYDPLDPDRVKKLEDTMGLFAKLLIKASTEA